MLSILYRLACVKFEGNDRIDLITTKGYLVTIPMSEFAPLFTKEGIETLQRIANGTPEECMEISLELSKRAKTVTNNELKFALFDETDSVTDEMLEEVKQFAAMVKMREDKNGGKPYAG